MNKTVRPAGHTHFVTINSTLSHGMTRTNNSNDDDNDHNDIDDDDDDDDNDDDECNANSQYLIKRF